MAWPSRAGLAEVAGALATSLTLILVAGGCPSSLKEPSGPDKERVLLLGPTVVAEVSERYDPSARTLLRRTRLKDRSDDESEVLVKLDERGFVERARYRRRGGRGDRDLSLKDGQLRSGGRSRALPDRPLVVLEALCRMPPPPEPVSVELVDLATGETLPGRISSEEGALIAEDRLGGPVARCDPTAGQRIGPGAFYERSPAQDGTAARFLPVAPEVDGALKPGAHLLLGGLAIPVGAMGLEGPGQRIAGPEVAPARSLAAVGQPLVLDPAAVDDGAPDPAHREPDLFFESDDTDVEAFGRRHATGEGALADALALAEAVHGALDTTLGGGPPSARLALERGGGDCDDATALLVAALRALGHPARPVVGYRAFAGRWVPHAWAELYDGERWVPVDGMVPGIGPFSTHLRLFEGLGSPLTLGRTLGALEVAVAPAAR